MKRRIRRRQRGSKQFQEMFWSTDLAAPISKLDELLSNGTATLEDVLEDDYTIQEIRNGNDQLVKFLTRKEVVIEILKGALDPEIDESLPLKEQYKKSHLCTEILSLNNEELSGAVMSNEEARSLLLNFMNNREFNHVIASFYMKIFSQINSRFPNQMFAHMKGGQFLIHCIRNMKHAAVMELIYRIVNGPSDIEQQDFVKQWFAESRFVENLCDLLVPEQLPVVHNNVSHLWSELVRILRDVQYTAECKRHDPLLESLQSERNVRHLVSRMLPDNVEQHCDSVIVNAAAILITLLETNFVPNCPSHQLGMEDRGIQVQWSGGVPVAENELNGATVWQPDAGHIVETVVAASADRIVNAIIDSLKIGDGDRRTVCSDAWCQLMRLLVHVLDTNHMATHQAVLAAFSSLSLNPFKLFLTYVNTRPQLALFQNLLHRAISYILYTLSSSPSPLIHYLIKDVDILGQTLAGCETSQADFLHGSSKRALHGFYMNLALLIRSSSESSPNAELITQLIQASDQASRWEALLKDVREFEEKNRPDDTGIIPPASNVVDTAKIDACDVPEPMVSNAAQLLDEYEQYLVPRSLPEDVTVPFPCSSHDTDYEIPDVTPDCDIAKDFVNIGNEDIFESMCTLRIDTSIITNEAGDGWPGASNSKEVERRIPSVERDESVSESFPVSWNDPTPPPDYTETDSKTVLSETGESDTPKSNVASDERKITRCVIEDKWPETSTPSTMDYGNWADFTSMKPDDWPPTQSQADRDAWDEAAGTVILSPTTAAVTGGIVSAIMAGNITKKSDRESSEC